MDTNSGIHFIGEYNFETVVIGEEKPLLLICMPRDDQFAEQVNIVMETAAKYGGRLKVGLVDESFIGMFKKRYHVLGTPTFLILEQGREINRSLGLADEQMLTALIADICLQSEKVS